MQRPEILEPGFRDAAVDALRRYFATENGRPTHSGARFETIGHAWNDPQYACTVTSADLLSLSTLSVPVPGHAAIQATNADFLDAASTLLAKIPVSATIGNSAAYDEYLARYRPGWELWNLVAKIDGFGPTYTSKLLARKRADLFPVYDTEINTAWNLGGASDMWRPLHRELSDNHGALLAYADELRIEAGVSPVVAPLRVLDAIVWRSQKDRRRAAASGEGPAEDQAVSAAE